MGSLQNSRATTPVSEYDAAKVATYNDMAQVLDSLEAGKLDVTITAADVTLTGTPAAPQAQNKFFNLSGTLTGNRSLIFPVNDDDPAVGNPRVIIVKNGTAGAFTVTVKVTGQTGVTVTQGSTALLIHNGTDFVKGPEWISSTGAITGGAPSDATYIVQTANGSLSAEQALGVLATGILKSTTTTGVLSIATANDIEAPLFAEDAGASDTYAATLSPAPAAYVTGSHYRFKANTANTGACTINFNSLGAKTIKKVAGGITTDLADNDIRAGQWVDLVYDGTNMQMQSLLGNAAAGGSFTPSTAKAYNNANISITSATRTVLTLNSEDFDADGAHSTVTNTSRLTCQSDGKYRVTAHAIFDANATGQRLLRLLKNGTAVSAVAHPNNTGSYTVTLEHSETFDLVATDYIEMEVYQDSGGALNVLWVGGWDIGATQHSPFLQWEKVG